MYDDPELPIVMYVSDPAERLVAAFPALPALTVRHIADIAGADAALAAELVEGLQGADSIVPLPFTGLRPQTPDARELARAFSSSPRPLRDQLLSLAVATEVVGERARFAPSEVGMDFDAANSNFVRIGVDGGASWASALHHAVVLGAATPQELAAAHRRASALDLPAELRVVHAFWGGDRGSEVMGALDSAIDYLARRGRTPLSVQLGIAAAEATTSPRAVALLAARAANSAAFEGDFALARSIVERLMAKADGDLLVSETAPARALRQGIGEADLSRARATIETRLEEARGDAPATNEALTVLALICMVEANHVSFADYASRCAEVGGELHPAHRMILTTINDPGAVARSYIGDAGHHDGRSWAQVAGFLATGIIVVNEMRLGSFAHGELDDFHSPNLLVRALRAHMLSTLLLQTQHWSAARAVVDEASRLADTVDAAVLRLASAGHRALADALAGRREQALAGARAALRHPELRQFPNLHATAENALSLAEFSGGELERAFGLLATREPWSSSLAFGAHGAMELFDFADLSTQIGADDVARSRIAAVRSTAYDSPRLAFVLDASEAVLARADSVHKIQAVLARAEGTSFTYETARLRLVFAERLRSQRRLVEARHQLMRVQADLDIIGAGAWSSRVSKELRLCARTPQHANHRAQLTDQENRIAAMAAAGLSNKEIGARLYMSPRTVSGHLYRVFPKLGITSRAALRDALTSGSSHVGLPAVERVS